MATSGLDRAILIAGPTASGKSAVALALARKLDAVIVNADAMQVYRDLRVLTARPDAGIEAEVPHRLYGHVDAGERYSVGRWLAEARGVIEGLVAEGRWAVVTGGTGLYFKALTEGLAEIPPIAGDSEKPWRARLAQSGPGPLHEELKRVDPEGAAAIAPGDSQRLVRALAVISATGMPLRAFHGREDGLTIHRRIIVQPERSSLYRRIEERFDAMVEDGALGEVAAILARGLDPNLPAMKAIGVAELGRHLAGEVSLEAAIAAAKARSRRYAKRQMTWIRGQMADWPVAGEADEAIAALRAMVA